MSKLTPTPSQTIGPDYAIGLDWLIDPDVAKHATQGERIVVSGRVVDGDGAPIPDAILEIWQADANGRYAHAEDKQDKPRDAGFKGYGRIPTDADGRFRFTTIKPGAVPGPGNSLQAPHILVALSMRGLLRQLYTRIYFSDEAAANAADPILGLVDEPARRVTLVAQRADGTAEYRWNICMQGGDETVFFDA
jgi:protocatechuate 3,4-dioxygenase alpha subunit